jgi:4-amino-4-deoxy-L-arabinose transferase-like glycosyltransferase
MKLTIPWLRKITLVTISLFAFLMWNNLGRDYLFDWDEGIYGQLGREMHETGHYLIPTWNDEAWLEKPPMIAWVTTLGIKLAGDNELGARLLMPLFAGLTLYAIYKLGEKLGGTLMGAASAGLLGYFNLFVARARAVNTDGILLAAIAWSNWLLISGAPSWAVGLVMGLAIMVKGPAGIMALLISLPLLFKKDRRFILSLLGVIALVVLPWHLYAYVGYGWNFITPYLMEQVIRRATVPIEFHLESRWFYFNFLAKDLGLGVVLATLLGFVLMIKTWAQKKQLNDFLLILWWVLIPLALFTLAKTRLSWYILPVYPGIALAVGYALTYFATEKRSRVVLSVLVVGMLMQMLWHAYRYVEPNRQAAPLSDTLQVAKALSIYDGNDLAMLVSESERVAQAILPQDQAISSSFRYGGAPSVVWYSRKHVYYYYNYDEFTQTVATSPNITTLIVATPDADKVPAGFKLVATTPGYLGYVREALYALR